MSTQDNPFIEASTLPYQLPPFERITDEHYLPAIEAGMAQQREEVEAIASQSKPADFDNTLVALERSGAILSRVLHVFYNKSSSDSNDATNAIEERIAPLLAAHEDSIRLDSRLYARISALWDARDDLGLDDERAYLLERYYTEFTLAGAGLSDDEKSRLTEYNARLSSLTTAFEKNLLADTNDLAVVVEDVADLAGLSSGEISAAAQAAADRGLEGSYVITLVLPTGHPSLASLQNRDVRERIMTASRSRGTRGGDHDNRSVLLEIVKLRAERARLLGFADHASFVTADQTAKNPENVADMLERLAPAAARNARAEQAELARVSETGAVESWDWAFLTEIVRRERYAVDTAAMRPYFESERVYHDGIFTAASKLYGLSFTERPDLVAYHQDARVFEVFDEDGSALGLFILDLYTRDSKRGGAWMNSLIAQNRLLDQPTIVVNNLNVPKPSPGEPTLLSYDEVVTAFHEFGHALHGLLADVTFPRFSGTSVHRDFVEFPSQVNEMWMLWPEILANYAVHHTTGEPMPADLVQKLHESAAFNEGFSTSEYLAAALLDQAWHRVTADEEITDVAAFEAAALARVGLDNPSVPPRYASTYFAHTFSGGYDAGYYSYIWSEVLDADTVEWFRENGGLTRENGDRFRRYVLGIGGSTDPIASYREFRGRDADITPLLKRRGLLAD
ncbi:peptidyl-dipeptidase Dcp [Labedella gwakjiensis]|uniref:M3 family peptidase n=1 Tax=Labedella gwakjiensis TaxID=390269 RepID=A0A2P8H0G7_9MICO|nr:M3 family metallopeptidase [Labedella gwakjiensis]PSL39706.1 peptidyl-dipeptidase Dcp [Labedella gwakjiensis]RUQ85908.1 M3 family peptidase [Labedella gwakjiensis]